MDYSGTTSTRNPMTTWGDGGKREGEDDDSRVSWRAMRFRVVVVERRKSEPERHDTYSA